MYFLFKKYVKKIEFIDFRKNLIMSLLQLPSGSSVGQDFVSKSSVRRRAPLATNMPSTSTAVIQHYIEKIPVAEGSKRKTVFHRCKFCYKIKKIRKETSFRCKTCPNKPSLCVEPCFEQYHADETCDN